MKKQPEETVLPHLNPVKNRIFRITSWGEILPLFISLIILVLGFSFILLVDAVRDGDTKTLDETILRSLRQPNDPAVPIGPDWVREAGMDITALGSPIVMILGVIFVIGLMLLEGRFALAALTVGATVTGSLGCLLLKHIFERERPAIVPHLREVTTPSFPSGHAMIAAIVFLTLGIALMEIIKARWGKFFCLACALFLMTLVGLSRIYLGVHYPTDVLAGWLVGIAWALACWICLQIFRGRIRWRRSSHPLDKA